MHDWEIFTPLLLRGCDMISCDIRFTPCPFYVPPSPQAPSPPPSHWADHREPDQTVTHGILHVILSFQYMMYLCPWHFSTELMNAFLYINLGVHSPSQWESLRGAKTPPFHKIWGKHPKYAKDTRPQSTCCTPPPQIAYDQPTLILNTSTLYCQSICHRAIVCHSSNAIASNLKAHI